MEGWRIKWSLNSKLLPNGCLENRSDTRFSIADNGRVGESNASKFTLFGKSSVGKSGDCPIFILR